MRCLGCAIYDLSAMPLTPGVFKEKRPHHGYWATVTLWNASNKDLLVMTDPTAPDTRLTIPKGSPPVVLGHLGGVAEKRFWPQAPGLWLSTSGGTGVGMYLWWG